MISIIDYGMGNLGSISNMLKKIGTASKRASNTEEILKAEKIILPGVGSFDNAMEKLITLGFTDALKEKAVSETPILGICLGMQLLGSSSEEGDLKGLNLIPGIIRKFPQIEGLTIPHMGWNNVIIKDKKIYNGLEENKFYFVHSYYFEPENDKHIASTTNYGFDFVSSVKKLNIYGVQFHPEKSHKYGMKLLSNFVML
jgi:glutamine amidotransferase